MSGYEKRIRQRFPELVKDPIWPTVERMVQEDWRDDDEYWIDGVQQHCIDLCKRLGLAFGPVSCTWCEAPYPGAGDVPDTGPCPRCVADRAEQERKAAEHKAWYEALGPEEKKAYDTANRFMIQGLLARDVQ